MWRFNHTIASDNDCAASRSNILLSTSVNDIEFGPVDWARTKIRRHISDNNLAFGNKFVRERLELNTNNCFIVTEVEDCPLLIR